MVGILAITDPVAGPFAGTALTHQDKLAYATGGIVVSGLVYLLLALIVKIVGPDKFMRFLPHAVTGPTVVLIGVILAPFAINQSMTNPILAVLTLAIIIIAMIWGSKMTKTIPILLGLVGAYIIAIIMNALGMTNADGGAVVSFAAVADASIVGLPPFMLPRFNIVAILIMVPFSFATIAEHVADMVILGEAMDEDLVRDKPGLPRTLFGDGVATTIASLFGTPASTTYSENVGLTLLTKVFSSRVVQIGACFAILLGLSPLFAAVVNSIPPAVIGGASIMLYGMIAAVGMKNVKKHVDLNFEKYLIIMAVMLVVGIGMRFGNAIVVNIAP
jgi:uracil permease